MHVRRLVLALMMASSSICFAQVKCCPGAVTGWVSDSKCGAKGAKAAECTKKCIQAGAKMVVVTDKDDKVITIDNPEKLKGLEGHHVKLTGKVSGDTFHVEKVEM